MDDEKKQVTFEKIQKKLSQNQSIRITKGVLKQLKEEGGDTDNTKININYQPVMIVNEKEEVPFDESLQPIKELMELLWTVIDHIPHPKLSNLRKLAILTTVQKHNQSQKDTAAYLKMQRTYICRIIAESKEEGIFVKKPDYCKHKKPLPEGTIEVESVPVE